MTTNVIRLFIVEDLERVRAALRSLLQCEPGFEIIGEAPDGATALRLLDECHPDIILMDLMLPDMTGIEIIHRLRSDGLRVPIVCLTLHSDLRAEAEASGATLFLEKGVAPDVLIEALYTTAAAA